MNNNEIRERIISDLLNVLKNQSAYYLTQSQSNDLSLSDRKEIEKELNDINSTLKDVTSVSAVYTIQQLEELKSLYQQKYNLILEQSQNLEINTLKIQFDSLTPQQKEFLKGQNGIDGKNGKSAYQIWLDLGYAGTEQDFISSLAGVDGQNGIDGTNGSDGTNGKSAYEIALDNGFVGTQSDFLLSLKGDKGADGLPSLINVDSMTQQQKQEIANLVTVTGGDSSEGLYYRVNYAVGEYFHFKTNIRVDKPILFALMISPDAGLQLLQNVYLYIDTRLRVQYINVIGSTLVQAFYISADGYLCGLFYCANRLHSFQIFPKTPLPTIKILDLIQSSSKDDRPWGTNSQSSYNWSPNGF